MALGRGSRDHAVAQPDGVPPRGANPVGVSVSFGIRYADAYAYAYAYADGLGVRLADAATVCVAVGVRHSVAGAIAERLSPSLPSQSPPIV